MKRKFLSLLLVICLTLGMLPATALAAEDEATTVSETTYVAKVGDTQYTTLAKAINAAKDGDTITLLSEIKFTKETAFENNGWYDGVKYTGDQSFTIDLNGKTISDNGELNDYLLYFMNKGSKANEITLKNGTISGGANLWSVLTVGASSATYPTTLNLGDNLIVIGDGSGINGETAVAKSRYGSIINVLDGATVKTDKADYCVAAGEIASDTTAIVNVYSGATITNNAGGIAVSGTANVNISGGTITSTGWGVYTMTSGTPVFTISGGSITGTSGAVASAADVSSYPDATPNVTVSGGTINGKVASINYGSPAENAGAELAVAGGTFSDLSALDYLGEDASITIKLADSVELTETVNVTGTVTLDLNGYTITNATTAPITISGGNLTVMDSSEAQTGAIIATSTGANDTKAAVLFGTSAGSFTLKSGKLQATKYGVRSANKLENTIVIDGGTIVAPTNGYGVYANYGSVTMNGGQITGGTWGIAAYEKFTMNGGTIEAELGYCSNGSYDNTVAVIKGGTIKGPVYSGVYWPSAGSLTIEGGSISGYSGVILKSGSLSITGGTLHGSGEKKGYEYVESGGTETGDALVIDNVGDGGYEAITSVSITGGTFTSEHASAVGSYTAGKGAEAVTGFISGGTFSSDPSTYLAEKCVAKGSGSTYTVLNYTDLTVTATSESHYFKDNNGSYSITMPAGATATVDFTANMDLENVAVGAYGNPYSDEEKKELVGKTDNQIKNNRTVTYTFSSDKECNTNGFKFVVVNGEDILAEVPVNIRIHYAITFVNGNSSHVTGFTNEGKAQSLPDTPSKDGYTFKGWFTAETGGTQITAETVFPANANVTAYAQWIPQHTVTFNANGGASIDAQTVDYGTTITLPTPTHSDPYYVFNGWKVDSTTYNAGASYTVTGDVAFTAQWYDTYVYIPSYTPTVTPSTSTETTENEDGSTTTTVTDNKTGTVTETTENTDGSTTTVETQKDGTVTETVENTDGSSVTTETKAETTENADGSTTTTTATKTESTDASGATVTETKTEETVTTETGSVTTSTTEVKSEDKTEVTETKAETTVKEDGTTETKTESTTTATDASGTVTTTTSTATETTTVTDEGATVTEKVEETKTESAEAVVETTTTATTTATDEKTETVAVTEETTTKADGTVETKTTTTTETALADGTTGTAVTDESGKTEATVTLSEEAAASETTVALPIPAVTASTESEAASTVTVTTNSEEATSVEIPVADVSAGTVAVIVNEDGTETVIQETKMTDNGLVIDVPDGATVKIVDNSTDFDDVEDHHWENKAVDFASARGLIKGVGNNTFDSDGTATRGQIVTLLARLAGVDTEPGEGEKWYDKGHEWAVENDITYEGNLDAAVSRQSMFTMMWRMLGCPESDHDISDFTDTDGLTQYTEEAARWAVEIGLMQGYGDGTMNPTGNVTRGELTQFLMNFIQLT